MEQHSPPADWRHLRAQNRTTIEEIRAGRLKMLKHQTERRGRLLEALSLDWVTPYVDMLGLGRREEFPAGLTSYWQRRYGANYPIYRTEQELALLRMPSRLLAATNTYAQGMLGGLGDYVISTGYTYRVAKKNNRSDLPDEVIDALQQIVDDTLARNQWHGGEQPSLERELFYRSIEDGEFLLVHYPQEDGWTDFRTAEPEQLTQPPMTRYEEYSFGIYTEANDVQKPLMYWLQWGSDPSEGEEYEPCEVTHLRRNVKRSMKRGLPDFTFDALDALQLAGRLRTNLGDAAAQQAAIVGVRQHDNASQADIEAFVDGIADFQMNDTPSGVMTPNRMYRRGTWEDVPKGQQYVPGPGANNAAAHLQILDGLLRSGGAKWRAPPWLLSGNITDASYASSLTAENPFVRAILAAQREYKEAFRRPILFALAHRVKTTGLRAGEAVYRWDDIKDQIDLLVEAPTPETRNKLEEAQRASVEIPLGVDSRQQYAQRQGRDYDQIEADNKAYQDSQGGSDGTPLGGLNPGFGPSLGMGLGQPQPDMQRPESLLESEEVRELDRVLLEQGFTGQIKDKAGHSRCYSGGKPVPCPDAAPAPQQPQAKPGLIARAERLQAHISERITANLDRLAESGTAGYLTAEGIRGFVAVAKFAEHRLLYASHKSREIAIEAAKRRGLSEEKTAVVSRTLAVADFAGGYVTGGVALAMAGPWAGKIASTLPTASLAYIAYSAAKDPVATWAAAVDVMKKSLWLKRESLADGLDLADFLADLDDSQLDWANALILAGIASGLSVRGAVGATERALSEHPEPPEVGKVDVAAVLGFDPSEGLKEGGAGDKPATFRESD